MPAVRGSDLRGVARLATEATAGLTDLVEAMHERIARLPGQAPTGPQGRTGGITGLVYRSVRGVTRVAGGSVDALLGLLAPALGPQDPVPQREALIAALNGVLGDHLAATGNPLAIGMALRRDGRALSLQADELASALPGAGGQPLVLVHGLCMNDLQWTRQGHDHGRALADALGFTPVYLHYNSGRHIGANGRDLAALLERLVAQWPRPLERLVLLGHSMGGLVVRSAVHQGTLAGHRWPSRLGDIVCLGTPHQGAPLERAGHWVDTVLAATPYVAPFARLGKVRSAGITDLRHGHLLEEDGPAHDRFVRRTDPQESVPLPEGIRCWAVAGSVGQRPADLKERWLGDGLVPLDSALGRHPDPLRSLAWPAQRQWVGHGINHLDLLCHPRVTAQLLRWLAPGKPA